MAFSKDVTENLKSTIEIKLVELNCQKKNASEEQINEINKQMKEIENLNFVLLTDPDNFKNIDTHYKKLIIESFEDRIVFTKNLLKTSIELKQPYVAEMIQTVIDSLCDTKVYISKVFNMS